MSENLTEALAEIERQRAELKDAIGLIERLREEIRHLRATLDHRMTQQDAAQAVQRGTLAPQPANDEPGHYTHNVPPDAPV